MSEGHYRGQSARALTGNSIRRSSFLGLVGGRGMRGVSVLLLVLIVGVGCDKGESSTPPQSPPSPSGSASPSRSFAETRKAFSTRLTKQLRAGEPVAQPPAELFLTRAFDSPVGKLAAYLTP